MIELLDEFCCVARYLNITHAAAALNMSQPNLSRHLRQLERKLGFNLFNRQGGSLALTDAGRKLADSYPLIRDRLYKLLDDCKEVAQSSPRKLIVHETPYTSDAVNPYYSFLKEISSKNTRMEFRVLSRMTLQEALSNGTLDVGVAYAFRDQQPLPEADYSWSLLCEETLGAWVDTENELADKEVLSFSDIATASILMPNDSYHPTREALEYMFAHFGADPQFMQVNTKSRVEFMSTKQPDCVLIYPLSMEQNPYLRIRDDLRCIPLDEQLSLKVYVVWRRGDTLFPADSEPPSTHE